jgi:predicted RND superfamily exporter protein
MTEPRTRADKFAELVFRYRRAAAAVLIAATMIAAAFATRVTADHSVKIWFLEDDPDLRSYAAFTERFQFDETVVIALFADDVFEPRILAVIDQVTRAAEVAPFVHRALSITSAAFLGPEAATEPSSFRERVLANRILNGTFVTPDGRAAAIIVQVAPEGNEFRKKRELVAALRTIVAARTAEVPVTVRMSGTPVVDDAAMTHSEQNIVRVVPLIIVVAVVIPLLIFRNLLVAVWPLVVASMAALCAYGFMGLIGWHATLISSLLLPLLLVVGTAETIHLLSGYLRERELGRPHGAAIERALARLTKPCCFMAATTVAGLLSLSVGRLEPIQEFAVTSAVGVLCALAVCLGVTPAALGWLGERKPLRSATPTLPLRLVSSSSRSAPLIVAGAVFVMIAFAASGLRLHVGVDPLAWFPENDPVRIDAEHIDAVMSGSVSLEFLVSMPAGGFQEPANLRRLDDFQRWLEAETPVSRVISAVDLLKEGTRATFAEGPDLPVTRLVTRALLAETAQRIDLAQWIDSDYAAGRLSARLPLSRAAELINAVPEIEAEIAERFPDESLRVEVTGYSKLIVAMEQYVITSQINSLAMSFGVIALMIAVLLRSWRLALLAIASNTLPVIVGLGAMPLLGIGLNPGTSMIGAVALGIIVDDAVHLLSAYRDATRRGAQTEDALRHALDYVGRPVVVTSLTLASGFAALMFGNFEPSRQIGMVTAIIVVMALVANLFLLPALIRLAARWRLLPSP